MRRATSLPSAYPFHLFFTLVIFGRNNGIQSLCVFLYGVGESHRFSSFIYTLEILNGPKNGVVLKVFLRGSASYALRAI